MASVFRWGQRSFLVHTQWPPFSWIYAWLYQLALILVVRRLSQLPPVRSIYLVGGLLDAPVYGVSDIDLHIFVEHPDPFSRERVVQELHFLKVWFPMLDRVESIGVYELSERRRWFDTSVEGQLVLGPQRPRRLLMGPDVMADLVPTLPVELRAQMEISRLGKVLHERLEAPPEPDGMWQVAKVLLGVWRVVMWQRSGHYLSRGEVLRDLEQAGILSAAWLARLRAPLRNGIPAVGPFEVWSAFHQLVRVWQGELSPAPQVQPGQELGGEVDPEVVEAVAELERVGIPARVGLFPLRQESLLAPLSPRWMVVVEGGDEARYRQVMGRLAQGPELSWWWQEGEVFRNLTTGEVVISQLCPEVDGKMSPQRRVSLVAWYEAHLEELRALIVSGQVMELPAEVALRAVKRLMREAVWCENKSPLDTTEDLAVLLPWLSRRDLPPFLPAPVQRRLLRVWRAWTGKLPPGIEVDGPLPVLPLSVLVCTRNRAELLRVCLAGLTRQTRPPDQVVVVDNGSSDTTRQVVAEFEPLLPVTYVYLATPGIPLARNAALKAATGDILCFTDDDALPEPEWLAQLEDTFQRDPAIGLVGGDAIPARRQQGSIGLFFQQFMGLT